MREGLKEAVRKENKRIRMNQRRVGGDQGFTAKREKPSSEDRGGV